MRAPYSPPQSWRAKSSKEIGCSSSHNSTLPPYCDADGDGATLSSYSAFQADAVVVYAKAMHAIFRSSGSQSGDALYAAIKTLEPFESIGGGLTLSSESADRIGRLTLLNLQTGGTGLRRRLQSASLPSFVAVGTYQAAALGADGSSDGGGLTVAGAGIVFPGGLSYAPADTDVLGGLLPPLITVIVLLLVGGLASVGVVKYRARRRLRKEKAETAKQREEAERQRLEARAAEVETERQRQEAERRRLEAQAAEVEAQRQRQEADRQRQEAETKQREAKLAKAEAEAAKRELNRFKESLTGVRAVTSAYTPSQASGGAALGGGGGAPAADGDANVPRDLVWWGWHEDDDRLSAHRPEDVFKDVSDGKSYVRYAWNICEMLEDTYKPGGYPYGYNLIFDLADTSKPKSKTYQLAMERDASLTKAKKHAANTGALFKLVGSVEEDHPFYGWPPKQRNVSTGFERLMFRRVLDTAQLPKQSSATAKAALAVASDLSHRQSVAAPLKSANSTSIGDVSVAMVDDEPVPDDLKGEDLLCLEVGQLLQTNSMRPDGWARGQVVYDEVDGRPASTVDGISTTSGWFPVERTALPDAEQLEKMQKKMGGSENASEALKPPPEWSRVADPMVAELKMLPDGPEKDGVVKKFMASLSGWSVRVLSVERVQNMSMWQSFAVKRQTVLQREKDPKLAAVRFEKELFHGTDQDTVPKITQQGFNRSFCGKNATAYGKGVYFATNSSCACRPLSLSKHRPPDRLSPLCLLPPCLLASCLPSCLSPPCLLPAILPLASLPLSASLPPTRRHTRIVTPCADSASTTYSRPNAARTQHMFLCRVVIGEYCQGITNALAPAVRSGHLLYDSTVDNMSAPNMYITYHDSQACA